MSESILRIREKRIRTAGDIKTSIKVITINNKAVFRRTIYDTFRLYRFDFPDPRVSKLRFNIGKFLLQLSNRNPKPGHCLYLVGKCIGWITAHFPKAYALKQEHCRDYHGRCAVIRRYAAGDYSAREWYEGDPNIRRAIDFLTGEQMLKTGDREVLQRLQNELIGKDWFQTLPDFNAYVLRRRQAMEDYAVSPMLWAKKCLVNIAQAGYFSSDRTIADYDRDIWHLGQ